jgi:hypothetical protein
MNLWAKSLRQLIMLSVALIFFSCEDESSIIGYPNPNKKFKVTYVEIPLETSVMLLDSIITDNKQIQSGVTLVGQYNDNLLGPVRAESYLQLFPAFTTKLSANGTLDSVVFQVRLNHYAYGLASDRVERFTVHNITGDSLNRLASHSYYESSSIAYDPAALGTASAFLSYEELKKEYALPSNQQDTLLMRATLNKSYGDYLFGLGQTSDFSTREGIKKFIYDVKGLALAPSESSAILGLDISSPSFSRLILYYHTPEDTLSTYFVFNPASFSNISTDRTASELAGLAPGQLTIPASGNRYVQSGSAVVTKVDLTNFYAFADTVDNILINSAELLIDNVESPAGLMPHSSLRFRFMKENTFFTSSVSTDLDIASKYFYIPDGAYFSAQADNSSQTNPYSIVQYNSEKKQLSGYLTLFAQSVFNNKDPQSGSADRLHSIALFPNAPFIARSVNRTVFHKDNIKLRISYTRPLN